MAIVTTIIDALRTFGSPTQKTAIQRQDQQLEGRQVIDRRRHVARSELGESLQFVATVAPVAEIVIPLTDEELAPIFENADLVDRFIQTFTIACKDRTFIDELDGAFGAWSEAQDKKRYSSEAVTEIVGAAFGKFCTDKLDMRWVRIVDEFGSALAVQGRSKDFRAFPYDAISKRIPLGEYGFFKPIFISLQEAADGDWKPAGENGR